MSLAFFMSACGDDNSSGASVDCLDNESCLDDDLSSSSDDGESSSSVKAKSSSSQKAKSSSSEKAKSSSSKKDDKSSSSTKDDKSSSSAKSSSSEKANSSSSAKSSSSEAKSSSSEAKSSSSEAVSSSSEEPESSSSVELKVTFLSETPNAADLEVSGDTLFAVFQRYVPVVGGADFKEPGLLAMYKLSDGTLLDTIPLLTKNPQAIKMVKGSLYVGTTGGTYNAFWGTDADENRGIEKVDLKNKKSELWVSGTQLGAGVYMMGANTKTGKIYVTINKGYDQYGDADMPVMEVDVATKAIKKIDGIYDGSGSIFFDSKTGLVYIGDRGNMEEDEGYVAYRYDGTKLTALYDDGLRAQPAGVAVAGGEVFVYINDYSTSGKLHWIEEEGPSLSANGLDFSTDVVIVEVNDGLYVLDRKGKGSIAKVNTTAKTVAWQQAFEDRVNPYDIVAIDNNTAWVALYDVAEIRKISLTDGSTISSIDTKEFSAKKIEAAE